MICPYCNEEMKELKIGSGTFNCLDDHHLTYYYAGAKGYSLFVDEFNCVVIKLISTNEYSLIIRTSNNINGYLTIDIDSFLFEDSYKVLQKYFNLKSFL